MHLYDLIIVGAGPAGLSCAIAAKKEGLDVLLCDKGNVVDSIIKFPTDMTFFSTADVLELADIPFNSLNIRPKRSEVVKYYQSLVNHFKIPIQAHATVTNVIAERGKFSVIFDNGQKNKSLDAVHVVMATGFYDNPNVLGIPGENLPHVSHYYTEPYTFFKKNVIVVGGKNSAVETALDLYRHGAKVSLVHRRSQIQESVKYWILPDIENRIKEGSIKVYLNSQVHAISREAVTIKTVDNFTELQADAVFLMTGYHPDIQLLKKCGVQCDPDSLEPKVNEQTLESNVSGLFIAGSLLAGKNANRIFIENSREHGNQIITAIKNR